MYKKYIFVLIALISSKIYCMEESSLKQSSSNLLEFNTPEQKALFLVYLRKNQIVGSNSIKTFDKDSYEKNQAKSVNFSIPNEQFYCRNCLKNHSTYEACKL